MQETQEGPPRTHDVAEVDVEEATIRAEHNVVLVSVPHAQYVRHHAVPRAALAVVVHRLLPYPERRCFPAPATRQYAEPPAALAAIARDLSNLRAAATTYAVRTSLRRTARSSCSKCV